jgi:hypothetical protein
VAKKTKQATCSGCSRQCPPEASLWTWRPSLISAVHTAVHRAQDPHSEEGRGGGEAAKSLRDLTVVHGSAV